MPRYRVTHGDIIKGGASVSRGGTLEMSVADAAELGAAVELIVEVAATAAPVEVSPPVVQAAPLHPPTPAPVRARKSK